MFLPLSFLPASMFRNKVCVWGNLFHLRNSESIHVNLSFRDQDGKKIGNKLNHNSCFFKLPLPQAEINFFPKMTFCF